MSNCHHNHGCQTRHVCFKDLEDYLRKDDYLSGFSKSEYEEIRKNLGVLTEEEIKQIIDEFTRNNIQITHNELSDLISKSKLRPGNIYVITDFQTIYNSNTGETWGHSTNHPSKIYQLIVFAINENTLSKNIRIISSDFSKSILWEAKYDPTSERVNGIPTKGKITYLKDEFGNSAYFDFKNIKYRVAKDELKKLGLSGEYEDYYTFNDYAFNVNIEDRTNQNIFLKSVSDVTIQSGSTKNIFNTEVRNTILLKGTKNQFIIHPLFKKDVFKTISPSFNKYVVSYIDDETLTQQVYETNNIY